MLRKALAALILLPTFAYALPAQTLFVRASHLGEETFVFYSAYSKSPATEDVGGSGIVPMNEDVATTLASLQLDRVYECTAHAYVSVGKTYVYQLSGCH